MTPAPKFTAGPWLINRQFMVGPLSAFDDQSAGMVIGVADVYGENKEADAHLIAAAPQMYESLEILASIIHGDIETTAEYRQEQASYAKSILAAARGEVQR